VTKEKLLKKYRDKLVSLEIHLSKVSGIFKPPLKEKIEMYKSFIKDIESLA
jgi:hypothetical protein